MSRSSEKEFQKKQGRNNIEGREYHKWEENGKDLYHLQYRRYKQCQEKQDWAQGEAYVTLYHYDWKRCEE
jgi:hypothetical protein